MASYDAVCISSDDESPFDRNQRLLKEYHEEEDRRRIQSHLSRVLSKVIEGKRHTFRIAARPELSKIPIAIPLASPLEVTVAYKPGDFKFNVMSQGSQTESVSPPPAVQAEDVPFGALLFQSTIIDNSQISATLRKCGIKISSEIAVRVPTPSERSCNPPRGHKKLRYSAWSEEHLKAGALLPLRDYFKNYLNYVNIAPFQLQPNGYRILSALKSLYHLQEWGEPSPVEISYLLALKKTPPRKGSEGTAGFYYLAAWPQEKKLLESVPNKPPSFKDKFFWTGALGCKHASFSHSRK